MKILVMASTFPDRALDGSVPRFVYDLAEALSRFADVLALVPHSPGAARRESMGSVHVIRFPYWWPPSSQRLAPNMREQIRTSLFARLQVPAFLAAQIWSLKAAVSRHSVDIVNAHWLIPQGLTAAIALGLPRCDFRLALHVHAGDVYMLSRLPLGRMITRYVVARSKYVFASGSHVRNTLDQLLGYSSGARIQPMGVDVGVFRRPARPTPSETQVFRDGFVVFVGRFVEKKGTIYLIRAFHRVRRDFPELGLVLIGSGPEESTLRREVERLSLLPAVHFAGSRPHDDVANYLRHCRAAVVPSIVDSRGETEGMPTVVVESMMAGSPVVGTRVDGIPDLIRDRANGWLCRQKDPDDLAEKITCALQTPRDSPVVRAATRTAEAYEWSRVGQVYFDALRS